jgi:uncharacterized NAD(P)/FAD-binding protein YdhS
MQAGSATIAIIGGGFSGTVLAANLLHRPPMGPTRIVLVERRPQIGHGAAYGPSDYPFLLNVPAARMSATSYEPEHLIDFARRQLPHVGPETYLPRQLYGEYLHEFLRAAERTAPRHVQLECVHGEVTALRPQGHGQTLVMLGERQLLAEQVVLACGDPPPPVRRYAADVADCDAYVAEPYQTPRARSTDRTLLLIGTGLTMVDIAVAAAAEHPALQLIALSRHGRLPASQPGATVPAVLEAAFDRPGILASHSVRELAMAVRVLAEGAEARGGDWREAIARMRECAPGIWAQLDECERRRFLRHVRVYWETRRHRMPPEFAQRVAHLRRERRLEVRAGTVDELRRDGKRIAVRWRARGQREIGQFVVDRVVDCTGSDNRLQHTTDVLWRQLLEAGLATPDALGLGPCTGPHGTLIDASGCCAQRLFYLGPMLRAAYWEATAVGELRARAETLAAMLANREPAPMPAETGSTSVRWRRPVPAGRT